MNYIRAYLRNSSFTPRTTRKIIENVPLLLLWGTKDGALSTGMAELSRKYVKDFTLNLVDGASHWVQQDAPELVNKYMTEFLDG